MADIGYQSQLLMMVLTTGGFTLAIVFFATWRQDRRREFEYRRRQQEYDRELKEKELSQKEWDRNSSERKEEEKAEREAAGLGTGGYIVLDLPNDKRPLFHDLLKGFEDYARLKGYEVCFSIDATYIDKIAFKFTIAEHMVNVAPERVRRDFKEYIDKIRDGEGFDEMPIVTSFEEHDMLVTVLKNRLSFLQHSYNLAQNAVDFYEGLIRKSMSMPVMPSQNILVQTGGAMDSRSYNSVNSSKIIQGDSSQLLDYSTTITIGNSFNSKKKQIDKIDDFLNALKADPHKDGNHDAVIRDVEKVKDELQDEAQPDRGRVAKWLERAKQTLQLGSLGAETVSAAKELFTAFGINL